jgi:CheY-like chemotaxis protein
VPGAEILLVEDDDLNQALVPAILARSDQPRLRDAHVTVVGTLAEARAVLAAHRIDLVLLDMRLPDGSGLPLATELRDQPGPTAVVIALTGAPAEHGDDALAAGCVAVLGKPYSLAELRKAVAAHLPRDEPAAVPGPGNPPGAADEIQAGPEVDFGLLFSSVPGMYLVLDPELKIVAVSDAYAQATRVVPAEMLGRSLWAALPEDPDSRQPGALPGLRASLDRVCQDKVADTMEVRKRFMPPPDTGHGTYEACYFRPANIPVLGPGGKLRYIIHALEDVTISMEELERAHQAERAAHDCAARSTPSWASVNCSALPT